MRRILSWPKLYKLGGILAVVAVLPVLGNYPGSKFLYLAFSATFWGMLFSGGWARFQYGYCFLVVALWLGFWGKVTVHLLLNYPYVEPVGFFDGSSAAWDEVLLVATLAGLGVVAGRLVFAGFNRLFLCSYTGSQERPPVWYAGISKWAVPLCLLWAIGLAGINLVFGIHQIGLVPKTIFPWPLNALVAWQVSIGSALLLAMVLWWEMLLNKRISVGIYALLIEGLVSTTSLLSRGIYIFHTFPQLVAIFRSRQFLSPVSRFRFVLIGAAFVACFLISIAGVTTIRALLYPHAGGFTTADQQRLTRLEVLQGGIARVKVLILRGESQEVHLRELLREKALLEQQQLVSHRELVQQGVSVLMKSGSEGRVQNPQLRELQIEKERLDKLVEKADPQGVADREFFTIKAALEKQKNQENTAATAGAGISEVVTDLKMGKAPAVRDRRTGLESNAPAPSEKASSGKGMNAGLVTAANGVSDSDVLKTLPPGVYSLLSNGSKLLAEVYYQLSSGVGPRILSLSVDRWVGVEGVMAVSAYPEKGMALLYDAATEKREIGRTTKFQEICKSHYRWVDSNSWQFASLPGAAAFFYFGGSLWVVFFGMLLFSFAIQLLEKCVEYLTSNPLMCSLIGLTLANTVVQFGITPRQDVQFYVMIAVFVFVVFLIQSEWGCRVLSRLANNFRSRSSV